MTCSLPSIKPGGLNLTQAEETCKRLPTFAEEEESALEWCSLENVP